MTVPPPSPPTASFGHRSRVAFSLGRRRAASGRPPSHSTFSFFYPFLPFTNTVLRGV